MKVFYPIGLFSLPLFKAMDYFKPATSVALAILLLVIIPAALANVVELNINYAALYINNTVELVQIPPNSTTILPIACTGYANVTLVIDPRSPYALSGVYVVYYNGSLKPITGLNTPRYASTIVNCRSTYGLLVSSSTYPQTPPFIPIYFIPSISGNFSGSGNLTITLPDQANLLYMVVYIASIGGSVSPMSGFTFLANVSQRTLETPIAPMRIVKYTYLVYGPSAVFKVVNSTVYYSVVAFYKAYYQEGGFWSGYAIVLNNSYYTVRLMGSYRRVNITAPVFSIGQMVIYMNGSAYWSISKQLIGLNPPCINIVGASPESMVGVPSTLAFSIGNLKYLVNIYGLPINLTIQIPGVVEVSNVTIRTLDGYTLNGTIYLMSNGSLIALKPGLCIPQGIYSGLLETPYGGFKVNVSASGSIEVTAPIYHVVRLAALINTTAQCPINSIYVNATISNVGFSGRIINITLLNVKYLSVLMVNALVNGTPVGLGYVTVTGPYIKASIVPRVVKVSLGLFNLISHHGVELNIGNLTYVINRSSYICVPQGASTAIIRTPIGNYVTPIVGDEINVAPPIYIIYMYLNTYKLPIAALLLLAALIYVTYRALKGKGGDVEVVMGG